MHTPFHANAPMFWVDEILVRQDSRNSGIGKHLMSMAEQWSANRGCVQILLASSGAGGFYETLGYQATAGYFKKAL